MTVNALNEANPYTDEKVTTVSAMGVPAAVVKVAVAVAGEVSDAVLGARANTSFSTLLGLGSARKPFVSFTATPATVAVASS